MQLQQTAHRARGPDIQHFKELQHGVEQAEAELESRVQALSSLSVRAEMSEQLAANMQVMQKAVHSACCCPAVMIAVLVTIGQHSAVSGGSDRASAGAECAKGREATAAETAADG